jgi:hypothetical protein
MPCHGTDFGFTAAQRAQADNVGVVRWQDDSVPLTDTNQGADWEFSDVSCSHYDLKSVSPGIERGERKTIAPLDLEHAKGFPPHQCPNSRHTAHGTLKKG